MPHHEPSPCAFAGSGNEFVFNDMYAPAGARDERLRAIAKRGSDIILASMLIVFLLPLMLGIALILWVNDPGSVIYRHKRIGRDGVPFDCLKFRTMVLDADRVLEDLLRRCPEARAEWEQSRKLRDDPRIVGWIGAMLRRTSLDELPQLVNVLRGEMSLVGPRPVTRKELSMYGSNVAHYLATTPGLTGPWQVSGRSDMTFDERVRIDVEYALNRTFMRDLAILFRTAFVVVARRGAY